MNVDEKTLKVSNEKTSQSRLGTSMLSAALSSTADSYFRCSMLHIFRFLSVDYSFFLLYFYFRVGGAGVQM